MYKGYLIDLDGTAYRGSELIPETLAFVKNLHERGIPYLFLTNNSTKTPEMAAQLLQGFGYPASPEQVYTSSLAAAQYVADEQAGAKVFMIGEIGLQQALESKGLQLITAGAEADYVVIGLDRDVTYEKLAQACFGVRAGARFIVTNGDLALPTERGLMPGNGAMASVVSASTGVQPIFIGKPHGIIMEKALERIGLKPEETAMVGDNYHTDILAGINAGMPTIFIEGGVSKLEDVLTYEHQPRHIHRTLADYFS